MINPVLTSRFKVAIRLIYFSKVYIIYGINDNESAFLRLLRSNKLNLKSVFVIFLMDLALKFYKNYTYLKHQKDQDYLFI